MQQFRLGVVQRGDILGDQHAAILAGNRIIGDEVLFAADRLDATLGEKLDDGAGKKMTNVILELVIDGGFLVVKTRSVGVDPNVSPLLITSSLSALVRPVLV